MVISKPFPVEHLNDTLRGVPPEVDSVSCFGVEGGGSVDFVTLGHSIIRRT